MDQAFSLMHRFREKNIRFIAEKVETHQDYLSAVDIGFDYFQGYFFCRPEVFHEKEITSLRHAILLLGCEEMRRFISMVALSKLAPTKPDELIRSSCIKARFCESLGILSGKADLKIELFLAGMFSNIDAILDQPL